LVPPPAEMMDELNSIGFADRQAPYMLYRGHPISRAKFFLYQPGPNGELPIYSYTGFQWKMVLEEYKTFSSVGGLACAIRSMLESEFGFQTNHAIGTFYQDGLDSIGFHNDKPRTIDPNVPIFIFSFGQQRSLVFRENSGTSVVASIPMEEGSLFILGPKTNEEYQHAILPLRSLTGAVVQPRLSIIYRNIANLVPIAQIEKKAGMKKLKTDSTKDLVSSSGSNGLGRKRKHPEQATSTKNIRKRMKE